MSENKYPYKDRKYDVVSYDPKWPTQFEIYAGRVRKIFGEGVQIEHIGSTAVPGMSGKSCIDILVLVDSLKTVEDHMREMLDVGFEYAGQFVMDDSRLFRVVKDNTLLANIHFFPKEHSHGREMIRMRDYLRSHPDEVHKYSAIKNELYVKYVDDYASYRKYKDEYINALIQRIS
ncbi:GrpB family protein [Candidatus Campbellbacteria bacterium]|nr:MAG: GrpB family protein [Candidatus Campbellbacteria bacterium]